MRRAWFIVAVVLVGCLGVALGAGEEPGGATRPIKSAVAIFYLDQVIPYSRPYRVAFCVDPAGYFLAPADLPGLSVRRVTPALPGVAVCHGPIIVLDPGLPTQKVLPAAILRVDRLHNLMLVKVDGVADLPTFPLADSEEVSASDSVVVFGLPVPAATQRGDTKHLLPYTVDAQTQARRYRHITRHDQPVHQVVRWGGVVKELSLKDVLRTEAVGSPLLDRYGGVVGVVTQEEPAPYLIAAPTTQVAAMLAEPLVSVAPVWVPEAQRGKPVAVTIRVATVASTQPVSVALALDDEGARPIAATPVGAGCYSATLVPRAAAAPGAASSFTSDFMPYTVTVSRDGQTLTTLHADLAIGPPTSQPAPRARGRFVFAGAATMPAGFDTWFTGGERTLTQDGLAQPSGRHVSTDGLMDQHDFVFDVVFDPAPDGQPVCVGFCEREVNTKDAREMGDALSLRFYPSNEHDGRYDVAVADFVDSGRIIGQIAGPGPFLARVAKHGDRLEFSVTQHYTGEYRADLFQARDTKPYPLRPGGPPHPPLPNDAHLFFSCGTVREVNLQTPPR